MAIESKLFGTTDEGEAVTLYTLTNKNAVQIQIMTFGAAVTSIITPDRDGKQDNIVLGFKDWEEWKTENSRYFGVIAGRVANRVKDGKFALDGKEYQLAQNNGKNALHGGIKGFDKKNWSGVVVGNTVELTLVSPDGDEGYPGTLTLKVTYELTDDNSLHISYHATTDQATIVNPTNHAYFNLAGAGSGSILDHVVESSVTHYTPVGDDLIPTGELASVKDTPFDFSSPTAIGSRIDQITNGYDHNLVVPRDGVADGELTPAFFKVTEPKSGRSLEIRTTEPGMQFYCGGFLGGVTGREGKTYERYGGFCVETQHFPDSINQPSFPSIVLRPDQVFTSKTVITFPDPSRKRKASDE